MRKDSHRFKLIRITKLVNIGVLTPQRGLELKEELLKNSTPDFEEEDKQIATVFYCCLDCMVGFYSRRINLETKCPKCGEGMRGSVT